MSAKTHGTSRVYSRNLCGLPDETIRLEVRVEDETSGLSGAPFFMPLRQHSTLFLTFVAYPPYRRNNSEKISPKFLESGQNRRTFAVVNQTKQVLGDANKRINKIIISKIKTQVPEGH